MWIQWIFLERKFRMPALPLEGVRPVGSPYDFINHSPPCSEFPNQAYAHLPSATVSHEYFV